MARVLQLGELAVEVADGPNATDDRLLDPDWSQRNVYGTDRWGGATFGEVVGRLSLETHHAGLTLLDRWDAPHLPHLLRFLGVEASRRYGVTVSTSDEPLTDGFLTGLRFTPDFGVEQPHPLGDVVTAFVAAQLASADSLEERLRRQHGSEPHHTRTHRVFWLVEYPMFDNGHLDIGFGLLVEDRHTLRLWSRPVHYHK